MIGNIIDRRDRPYRWKNINAIIESTWHDNTAQDTDIAEENTNHEDEVAYDQRENISLQDAVKWANGLPGLVTLYLYDEGKGTS